MSKRKVNRIHYFSIAASALATLISIIILVFLKRFEYTYLLVPVTAILQVFALALDFCFQNGVISLTFGSKDKKDALLRKADPARYKNTIQGAREELRYGLKIMMTVAVACCLAWGFATHDILKTIICLCALGIAFIYADYIPHVKFYSKRYDAQFTTENEIPSSIRGLARIYLTEYKETRFKKNDETYKECLTYNENNINVQQDECIKNILRMGIDTSANYFLIFSIIVTSLTVLFIFPGIIDDVAAVFLKNVSIDTSVIYSMTILAMNFVLFVVNFICSYQYISECNEIYYLANLICDGTPKERYDEYKRNFENNYTIRSRGIFVFCSSYMDIGMSLDSIELKYRMLFTHRLDGNRARFWSTVSLLGLALLCLLIDFGVKWIPILVIGAIYAIFSIVFRFLFLDKLGKRRIIKICNELEQKKTICRGDNHDNRKEADSTNRG